MTKKAKATTNTEPIFKYKDLSSEEKALYNSDIFSETKKLVEFSIKNPGKDIDECYGALLKDGSIIES